MRCLLLIVLLAGTNCRAPNELSPFYYLVFPLKEGLERPTTPQDLQVEYRILFQELYLEWTGSTDPDLQIPIGLYRIYVYTQGPPTVFYQEQDLMAETALTFHSVLSGAFTGTLYFVVTASDGGAESYPSNVAQLNLLVE